jgi:hypothetical protein
MGAVLQWGPETLRPRMALVSIADNADDYGFACVSMESIAAKLLCVPRQAMRIVDTLERDGWMTVHRKAGPDGKGNVYLGSRASTEGSQTLPEPLTADAAYHAALNDVTTAQMLAASRCRERRDLSYATELAQEMTRLWQARVAAGEFSWPT